MGRKSVKAGLEKQQKLEKMQEEYVKSEGRNCPYCKSTKIESDELEVCFTVAWASVACMTCGKSWTDRYELTGFAENA